jgi:hypothetical protein
MGANANQSALSLNPQNMVSPSFSGGTLGASVGASSAPVIAANPQTQKITFHNPGSNNIIYVCQATDANGNALTAGLLPGNYAILPGAWMTFTGNGAGLAWLAACPAGGSNPLTIASSQTI